MAFLGLRMLGATARAGFATARAARAARAAHAAHTASTAAHTASTAAHAAPSADKFGHLLKSSAGRVAFVTSATLLGAALVSPVIYYADAGAALHPLKLKWGHDGHFASFDHSSLRRGYQVYKEVCAACHSLDYVAYRQLVGVTHTRDEMKALAAESTIEDGPDFEGNMFTRPRALPDYHPNPFADEYVARAANNGALPPDLSWMTISREDGANYVYSLLNGYEEAPPGFDLRPGLHYNTYFPGGAIGMKNPIYDGIIEYEDGTPATASQIAKDVTTFLVWSSQPELEERKLIGSKLIFVLSIATLASIWHKRYRWSGLKNRKIFYNKPKYDM